MKNRLYKVLSIVLSITMLLSVCFVSGIINAVAETTAVVRDYYVKYDGAEYANTDVYGTNGTAANPYKTVYDVVAAVNADATFNAAGNTFNVWIMQDIEAVANMNADVTVGSVAYATHNMVSWAKTKTTSTMESHNAKMVVKPYASNAGTTYLAFSTLAGAIEQMHIYGPAEFDNIEFVMTANDYISNLINGRINCNGNSVKFGSGVTYAYVNSAKSTAASWDGTITPRATITTDIVDVHDSDTAKVIEDAFEVEFENVINGTTGYTGFPTVKGGANYNFKNDVTIAITGAPYQGRLSLGGDGNKYASVLDKNLNLRLTGSTSNFQFAKNSTLIVKGGVQVIKSSSFSGSNVTYADISGFNLYATEEKTEKAGVWFINVDKSVKNHIDFVNGEKGKFQVPVDAVAVATDAEGNTYTSDKNGILDLSGKPGEYTVSITVKTYDYYVKGGAKGTGMSEDDPAGSIATAVTNMVASGGLAANDTANIWIMQDMTDITGTGATNGGAHNMAYWGTLPEFSNTIHIKPHKDNTYTGNVTQTLLDMGDGTLNKQSSSTFTGDTIVEGVMFVRTSSSNLTTADKATLFFNGNNVTLGKGVTFAYINANGNTTHPADSDKAGQKFSSAGWPTNLTYLLKEHMHFFTTIGAAGAEYSNPIKVVYNNDFAGVAVNQRLDIPGTSAGTYTFKDDVTVEFGGAANQASLRFGTSASGATITYASDLNLKFSKASDGIRLMKGSSKLLVKGGVQVITETGFKFANNGNATSLDELGLLYKEDGTTPADIWNINVSSLDKIDFTAQAGVYKIADKCNATATNKTTGETKDSVDGVLDLTQLGVGTYDITITVVREKVYDYYVKAGGTGDGTDINNPAPDVATAITTMNSLGLTAEETANIYVMQNITAIEATSATAHNLASWGSTVEHDATVVLKPYSGNTYGGTVEKAILLTNPTLGKNIGISLGGPTVLDDLLILFPYSSNISSQKAFNFNGQNATVGVNTAFAYLNVNSASYSNWTSEIPADLTTVMNNVSLLPTYFTNGTSGEFTNPVKVVFNKEYSTTSNAMAFLVIGDSTDTFKEDVTFELNLGASYNPRVHLGNSTGGAVFEKNLNFKLTDSTYFGFNNRQAITVDGGIQFIYDADKVSFHKNNPPSDLGKLAVKSDGSAADVWRILVTSDYIDDVNFVEGETGKFSVKEPDGLVAVATKTVAEGETAVDPVAAVNGVLDLSAAPGEYTISFVEEYITDWSTIRVYKDMDLDLANEKHLWVDGKVFIGWKYRDSDEYPQTTGGVASLKAGDVLVADYMDMAETDFELTDIELRADGNENDPAIRYIINKNKAFEQKLGAIEYGAIYLPADQAKGFEIFLDKEPVVSWYAYADEKDNNEEWAVRETTGYTPIQITADPEKVLEETETDLTYSICLTEIPEADYRTFYAVRGYMKFTDKNGIVSAAYTTQEVSSIYKEACEIPVEERTESQLDIIAKAEAQLEESYTSFKNSLKTPEEAGKQVSIAGEAVTDEEALESNALIYTTSQYGTQYLRNITVDTGMNIEDAELLFVTDVHVTYSNEKDIFSKYNNAIGYYKSRAYYGKDFNTRKSYAALSIHSSNMASLFDKVVLGGDLADYVSYGNYEATKRIWSDRNIMNGKSLKGTISMTPGNHEGSQASATPEEKMDGDVLHAFQNQYMVSNSEIDYDIVYKADGKTPNYMTVTIDNASTSATYTEAQYEALSEYIAFAEENNIPIILFQHIPMATWNEADEEYWYTAPEYLKYDIGGRTPHPALYKKWLAWKAENPNATSSEKANYADTLYEAGTNADGESYPKGWQFTNMYDGSGKAAHSGDSETALKVRQLITSNGDTIKAIICGHNHSNYDSGVVATDADGNKLKDEDGNYITIPQFTATAGYQHGSLIVNIK